MHIDIITGFPGILEAPLNESMIRQSQRKNAVNIKLHNLRDFTKDKHKTIDDYPYGGAAGMVLKIEPLILALDAIFEEYSVDESVIIMPSPRGQKLDQEMVTKLSLASHLVFICGHYKGIDERVNDFYPVREISLGDYILSAGEIAVLAMVDSIVRLLPGVMSDIDSAWTDSFNDLLLDAPYYTRPEVFRGKKVPEVLLSGNHKNIDEWRQQQREKITRERRPDLYEKYKNQ
ncbi:MAG: tRNA (guanosine(37)-N1)-methyltransferase TrmD [Calditrichaceae bacterium]|nr:tRNA (guanosine(37)-N1)-methyltransferase TrmD [Calditrichaceae bacterium]MBN2709176.1 tRNA (guanosine(37)-N1)-methyltransferase TrmD [Calditrichaceae bacterium]RQV96132.1 MAG: tRNA (guanosine(37)-N1)-methyltransferase TrmD [Calditrichota bacterium]